MVDKEVIVVLALLASIERSLSLSCAPCYVYEWDEEQGIGVELPNPDIDCGPTPTCSYGLTKAPCGCCDECAKGLGEDCGGEWGFSGRCAEGLECEVEKKEMICDLDVCWYPDDHLVGTCVGPNNNTCEDKSDRCDKFAAKGKCNKGKFFWKCKSACACGINSNPPCEDTMSKCSKLASKGKCSKPRIYKKCKYSCACARRE